MKGNAIIKLQMLSIFWVKQFTKIRMPLKQKSARFARCLLNNYRRAAKYDRVVGNMDIL